jgi:hypothetical protein
MPEEQETPRQAIGIQLLCPRCQGFAWRLMYRHVDAKTGETIRFYQCRCGERIWED